MARYFKGTKITGTSTTAKIFTKSGVSYAWVDDEYLNTSTGHVYKCTRAGKPDFAQWKYVRTDPVRKPSLTVTGLSAPARYTSGSNTRLMKITWKIPGDLTKATMGDRAEKFRVTWHLGGAASAYADVAVNVKEHAINLLNFKNTKNIVYNRNSFYPLTKTKMPQVSANIFAFNRKGNGKTVSVTRKFEAPRAPSIAAFTFDPSNGRVATTVATNAGTDYRERYDTAYLLKVTNTRTGNTTTISNSNTTSTSFGLSYDATDYQQLAFDQYICVTAEARARGYAGDSSKTTRSIYIAYPNPATIKDVTVSAKDSTGKCTVVIATNNATAHPVDEVKLEYLADCAYENAADIPGNAPWQDTEIVDNANCSALAMPVADLVPSAGNYSWVRVKSYHLSESVLYRYSNYWRVTQLETPAPSVAEEEIKILSAVAGEDGKSAVVTLGWNADGTDVATGTELTWSEYADAWKSTKNPDSYSFTWSDGVLEHEGVTYQDSATISIKNLTEGGKYYIRARRYLSGETTTYSPYSNIFTCVTSEAPESLVATSDRYVSVGSALPVYWTFSGAAYQQEWQIIDSNGTVLANGTGSLGATQIPPERLANFAAGDSLTFTVQASTGSGFVSSEPRTVTIVDAPPLSISVANTLTAQPFGFTATTDRACDLTVVVTSQGATGQYPEGVLRQTSGDTIYSGVITPIWSIENDVYSATVTLPGGLDFWDLGEYTISVTATDPATGLQSTEQVANFNVAWAHQAPEPNVEIIPIDTVDDTGKHTQAAQIVLSNPTGYAETDVYDIYRLTGDGANLIGQSFPLEYTATDEYAPFGDDITLYYRVATRTADGDIAFADFEYVAGGKAMRFDWEGGSLELPYNIVIDDKYKKDVQFRTHMDGRTDGYWNSNITRTAALSSALIRVDQQTDVALARALARYSGAVFVRTPDGSAYEADVQVTDMSTSGNMETITVDATEVGQTDMFLLPNPSELAEDE